MLSYNSYKNTVSKKLKYTAILQMVIVWTDDTCSICPSMVELHLKLYKRFEIAGYV